MSPARIAGALLLALAGAALGFERSARVKRRVRLLSALSAALDVMGEEISLLRTPLPELFESLAARGADETRVFFSALALDDGRSVSERWNACVEALPLEDEEREVLRALGMSLGRYDAQSQCARIELARVRLQQLAGEARGERDGKARTYVGLGLSLGAMIGVILL